VKISVKCKLERQIVIAGLYARMLALVYADESEREKKAIPVKEKDLSNHNQETGRQTETDQQQKQAVNTDLINELQKNITQKNEQIENLKSSASAFEQDVDRLNKDLEKSLASYRNMVIKAHPGVPEELISGKNVDEIDTSLDRAKKIVERVKKGLWDNQKAESVPVGAPARAAHRPENMSAREKIHYALGGEG
jgi:hypothetical protein